MQQLRWSSHWHHILQFIILKIRRMRGVRDWIITKQIAKRRLVRSLIRCIMDRVHPLQLQAQKQHFSTSINLQPDPRLNFITRGCLGDRVCRTIHPIWLCHLIHHLNKIVHFSRIQFNFHFNKMEHHSSQVWEISCCTSAKIQSNYSKMRFKTKES